MTVYCHITKAYLLFPISEMWYRSLQYKCAENGTTLHKGLCLVADIVLKTAQFYSQHSGHIHHYITMWCILSIISHQKPSTDTCNMLLINCISLKHEHAIYLWCVKAKRSSFWRSRNPITFETISVAPNDSPAGCLIALTTGIDTEVASHSIVCDFETFPLGTDIQNLLCTK